MYERTYRRGVETEGFSTYFYLLLIFTFYITFNISTVIIDMLFPTMNYTFSCLRYGDLGSI